MLGYLLLGLLATVIAQLGQRDRVALASDDGLHDGQPRLSVQIGDCVMDAHVHLVEALLHLLDALRAHLHEVVALPQKCADRRHILRRKFIGVCPLEIYWGLSLKFTS